MAHNPDLQCRRKLHTSPTLRDVTSSATGREVPAPVSAKKGDIVVGVTWEVLAPKI